MASNMGIFIASDDDGETFRQQLETLLNVRFDDDRGDVFYAFADDHQWITFYQYHFDDEPDKDLRFTDYRYYLTAGLQRNRDWNWNKNIEHVRNIYRLLQNTNRYRLMAVLDLQTKAAQYDPQAPDRTVERWHHVESREDRTLKIYVSSADVSALEHLRQVAEQVTNFELQLERRRESNYYRYDDEDVRIVVSPYNLFRDHGELVEEYNPQFHVNITEKRAVDRYTGYPSVERHYARQIMNILKSEREYTLLLVEDNYHGLEPILLEKFDSGVED